MKTAQVLNFCCCLAVIWACTSKARPSENNKGNGDNLEGLDQHPNLRFGSNGLETANADGTAKSQPSSNMDELTCFTNEGGGKNSCAWRNIPSSANKDQFDWEVVNGQVESQLWRTQTGSDAIPNAPFLTARSEKARNPTDQAMLVSRPIHCQSGDGVLSMNYWSSDTTAPELQTCWKYVDSFDLRDCVTLPKTAPTNVQISVAGPINRDFELVLVAKKYINDYMFVAVDNIKYQADGLGNCDATGNNGGGGGDTDVGNIEDRAPSDIESCKKLTCQFNGNTCMYDAGSNGWQKSSDRITATFNGNGIMTDNLKSAPVHFEKIAFLAFDRYASGFVDAYSPKLSACPNGNCVWSSPPGGDNTGQWQQEFIQIPKGDYQLDMQATNVRGDAGEIGLRNMQIYHDPMKRQKLC